MVTLNNPIFSTGVNPAAIAIREETTKDENFTGRVYASTRLKRCLLILACRAEIGIY